MMIQACLNGARQAQDYRALPLTPYELAEAAQAAVAAGAVSLHIHPRNARGKQSLDSHDVGAAIGAIRHVLPNVPLGVSTLWAIVPDAKERVAKIERWTVLPDFASVNFSEPGVVELCHVLQSKRIGIEVGLETAQDAMRFAELQITEHCVRVLLEPAEQTAQAALATVAQIEAVLNEAGVRLPRLLHGLDATAWPIFDLAASSGYETRVGLEDMLVLPNGGPAPDNGAILRAALERAAE